MKNLIRLTDHLPQDICDIFRIADELQEGCHANILSGKTVVMFFPASSIRTRVTFEKGVHLLGGQPVLFPADTLDKKEDLQDVCGYLNNWVDMLIVRHRDIHVLDKLTKHAAVPVINAMTDINHPCEVLADLYALSKIRKDVVRDRFLFCGRRGNIGLAWKEASDVLGFDLEQCCAKGFEIDGLVTHHDIHDAIKGKDVVCTDSLPSDVLASFRSCQVTLDVMKKANAGALLNPCPPFYRGEEVSADVIDSDYFVGYEFKKHLLTVQQAIMIYCLTR